jgi:hypothetical protein
MLELRLPPPENIDEAHLTRVRALIAQALDIQARQAAAPATRPSSIRSD